MVSTKEWSREFDIHYNNITSNQAPGLTEYEKSVFLTRAQEDVVISLYRGSLGESFEETEELTDYLASLIRTEEITPISDFSEAGVLDRRLSESNYLCELPTDLLFRTLEMAKITDEGCGERTVPVIPVTQDEYWRTVRNPFKKQNGSRVLRLAYEFDQTDGAATTSVSEDSRKSYSELISDSAVSKYIVRYIMRPEPIILVDLSLLSGNLKINGKNSENTCKLPEALHQAILLKAVQSAKAVWMA